MGKSRFHYAVLNMGISGTTTFLKMALSLIVRTIFIYYLGSKVLGLNSLLISILTTLSGADVKIMDRFFRHREVPDSENFSKPGFQLKKASFLGVFVGRTGPRPAGERKQVV